MYARAEIRVLFYILTKNLKIDSSKNFTEDRARSNSTDFHEFIYICICIYLDGNGGRIDSR